MKNGRSKRKGAALALSLVVLLVGGVLVAVSLYITENMMATTRMKTEDELRLNAALAGAEKGKKWLMDEMAAGNTPSRPASGDIAAFSPGYPELLVTPPITFTQGDTEVEVRIFDLYYTYTNALKFEAGMPPRILQVQKPDSLRERPSYDSSNAAEGTPGAATPGDSSSSGTYLVRSDATLSGLTKRVEQAIEFSR